MKLPVLLLVPYLGGKPGHTEHLQALEARARDASGDAQVALRLGQGLGRHGSVGEALRWADEAARRGAHPHRVHIVRGDAYFHGMLYEHAVREYFEVASVAPDNAYAHVQLWRCLREPEHLPEALDLARVRKLLVAGGYFAPPAPKRPREHGLARQLTAKGYTELRAGRFRAAAERFEAAIHQDDTSAEAFRGLGAARSRMGQARRALGAYRVYLELAPRENHELRKVRRLLHDADRRRGLAR